MRLWGFEDIDDYEQLNNTARFNLLLDIYHLFNWAILESKTRMHIMLYGMKNSSLQLYTIWCLALFPFYPSLQIKLSKLVTFYRAFLYLDLFVNISYLLTSVNGETQILLKCWTFVLNSNRCYFYSFWVAFLSMIDNFN